MVCMDGNQKYMDNPTILIPKWNNRVKLEAMIIGHRL